MLPQIQKGAKWPPIVRRGRTLFLSAAAMALAIPAACSAETAQQTAPSVENNKSIRLTGRIDAGALEAIKRNLSPETERLIINSAGGRAPEAIELGSLLRSRGVEVVVDGVCLSACAHFVFIPAKRKRLEPDSVVAFHQTSTAVSRVLLASGRRDLAAVYLPFAEAEQNLYRASGVSANLLVEPYQHLMPICYKEQEEAAQESEYRTGLFSTFSFYVPALADLYAQGVGSIEGNWPKAPSDIERALARYPRKLNLSFKMKLNTGGQNPAPQTTAVPECPDLPMYQWPNKARS